MALRHYVRERGGAILEVYWSFDQVPEANPGAGTIRAATVAELAGLGLTPPSPPAPPVTDPEPTAGEIALRVIEREGLVTRNALDEAEAELRLEIGRR